MNYGFATRAIHLGYDPKDNEGALTPPMHLASTFAFESAEAGGEIFSGEREGYFYSRISNPTLDILEKRIASLEGSEAGLALASGMGAISATLWTLLSPGDELIVDKTLYGCTFAFMHHGLAKFGIKITHVDLTDPERLAQAISGKTRAVYFETPANPNMRLVDISAVSEIALFDPTCHPWGRYRVAFGDQVPWGTRRFGCRSGCWRRRNCDANSLSWNERHDWCSDGTFQCIIGSTWAEDVSFENGTP